MPQSDEFRKSSTHLTGFGLRHKQRFQNPAVVPLFGCMPVRRPNGLGNAGIPNDVYRRFMAMPRVRFRAIKPHADRIVECPGLPIFCVSAKPKACGITVLATSKSFLPMPNLLALGSMNS
jgi:hypothetical protein